MMITQPESITAAMVDQVIRPTVMKRASHLRRSGDGPLPPRKG